MTHTLSADFPTYFGEPAIRRRTGCSTSPTTEFNLFNLTINEHTAPISMRPLHFLGRWHQRRRDPGQRPCRAALRRGYRGAREPGLRTRRSHPMTCRPGIAAKMATFPTGACCGDAFGVGREGGNGRGFRNFDGSAAALSRFPCRGGADADGNDRRTLDRGGHAVARPLHLGAEFRARTMPGCPRAVRGSSVLGSLEGRSRGGGRRSSSAPPKHAGGPPAGPARIFANLECDMEPCRF